MMTLAEALEKHGERRGRREELREALLKLLRARFGELPDSAKARVEAADKVRLDRWFDRALTARALDEVLADG